MVVRELVSQMVFKRIDGLYLNQGRRVVGRYVTLIQSQDNRW